jgi:hypothetical protein
VDIRQAEELEIGGRWFQAGEAYLSAARIAKEISPTSLETVKLLVRSATCFELAGLHRNAALAYYDAAVSLHSHRLDCRLAGELFSRSGGNYKRAGESSTRAAATGRQRRPSPTCPSLFSTSRRVFHPVPLSAGQHTVAA